MCSISELRLHKVDSEVEPRRRPKHRAANQASGSERGGGADGVDENGESDAEAETNEGENIRAAAERDQMAMSTKG